MKPRSEVLSPVTACILRCIRTAHTSLCVSHTLIYMARTWLITLGTLRAPAVGKPWLCSRACASDQPVLSWSLAQPCSKVS